MAVFWVVAPCSLVEVYQRFRGSCCLHHQGRPDDGGSKDLWNVGTPEESRSHRHTYPNYFWYRYILIFSSHLTQWYLHWGLPTKMLHTFSYLTSVLHVPPMSISTWWAVQIIKFLIRPVSLLPLSQTDKLFSSTLNVIDSVLWFVTPRRVTNAPKLL
jgi:hypothetical protein